METSHLAVLLKSLGPIELRAFDRFLASPYFNTRSDVYRLFQTLRSLLEKRRPLPERDVVFRQAFPDKALTDREIRLVMTYLSRLFTRFIQLQELEREPALADWLEVKALYRLNLKPQGDKALLTATERLDRHPLRDSAYHYQQYRLWLEQVRQRRDHPEANAQPLRQLTDMLHTTAAAMLLRQACVSYSQKAVYKMEPDTRFLPEVFTWVEMDNHVGYPAVGAYYYACKMLMTGSETWFHKLKDTVLIQGHAFAADELYDLHVMAINFCIRQINSGEQRYFHEVHELYKAGLTARTLLHNGYLSPLMYYNIVAAGLKINDLDWVHWFISHYKNRLERKFRDSAYSFNLARLHYARGEYGDALLLLQKANYRDLLTSLAAKTIALKIHFKQGDLDVLQSHLEAMHLYLRRKRILGYHRENYLNIIRVMKRMLALPRVKSPEQEHLIEYVKKLEPLTEKTWFLEMIKRWV